MCCKSAPQANTRPLSLSKYANYANKKGDNGLGPYGAPGPMEIPVRPIVPGWLLFKVARLASTRRKIRDIRHIQTFEPKVYIQGNKMYEVPLSTFFDFVRQSLKNDCVQMD